MTPEEKILEAIAVKIEEIRQQERLLTARRCAEIAEDAEEMLVSEDRAGYIPEAIRREFGLDGEGK